MKYFQILFLLIICVNNLFSVQNIIYHYLILFVTIFNILNHTFINENNFIKIIDKIFEHYIYINLTFINLPQFFFI